MGFAYANPLESFSSLIKGILEKRLFLEKTMKKEGRPKSYVNNARKLCVNV